MSATATIRPPRYTAVVPSRLAEAHPSTTVYIRRRLLVGAVLATIVAVLALGAGNVLANRGGAPASTSTVRPAASYLVRPGDTLWSIAEAHRGPVSQVDYVDALVSANGGTMLQIGEVITLP